MLNNLAAMIGVVENKPSHQHRGADKDRETGKYKWEELYHQKSNDEFMDKMSIARSTFNILFDRLKISTRVYWDDILIILTSFFNLCINSTHVLRL